MTIEELTDEYERFRKAAIEWLDIILEGLIMDYKRGDAEKSLEKAVKYIAEGQKPDDAVRQAWSEYCEEEDEQREG